MKFQDTSIHRLKVKKKVVRTHGQAQSDMPYQLFQSWGHKKYMVNTCMLFVFYFQENLT